MNSDFSYLTLDKKLIKNRSIGGCVRTALLLIFFFLLIETLSRGSFFLALDYMIENPAYGIGNLAIFSYLFLILNSLFNRKQTRVVGTLLFIALVFGILSHIKIAFRGTSLGFQDFKVANEAMQMLDVLTIQMILIWLTAAFIGMVLISLLLPYLYPKRTLRQQLLTGLCALLSLITVAFFPVQDSLLGLNDRGVLMGFLPTASTESDYQSNTKSQIPQWLEEMGKEEKEYTGSKEKPDIIMIQSESFFDITETLDTSLLSEDPLAHYHQIQQESLPLKVSSPAYGGDTANAEFEALTGMSVSFFQDNNLYVSYLNQPLISLASIFRQQGYYSLALHPYTGNFYKRDNAYKQLGFNEFKSLEKMQKEPGFEERSYPFKNAKYVSDEALNQQIIQALEKRPDTSQFIFGVTVQNHAPFSTNIDNLPKIAYQGELNKEEEGYLQGLKLTDQSLASLMTYLKGREKETLLVFYGDHQPNLSLGNAVYLNSTNYEAAEERHLVDGFIWSNKKNLKEEVMNIDMTSVGEILLDVGDFKRPNYFYYLKSLRTDEQVNSFSADYVVQNSQFYTRPSATFERIFKKYQMLNESVLKDHNTETEDWLIKDNKTYISAFDDK